MITNKSTSVDNMIKAREAIIEHMKGEYGSGNIKCPICGGDLRFSRSSLNGHIHANCSTPDCVSWME